MSPDPIKAIIEDFTVQIRTELQRQALEALNGGFEHGPQRPTRNKSAGPVGSKGAKRDPALLVKLQRQLLTFVKQNPGLRIEQINKQMGTSTRELALPIRKLIAAKELRTAGEKRATTYSAKA